jgi:hypothetical protein
MEENNFASQAKDLQKFGWEYDNHTLHRKITVWYHEKRLDLEKCHQDDIIIAAQGIEIDAAEACSSTVLTSVNWHLSIVFSELWRCPVLYIRGFSASGELVNYKYLKELNGQFTQTVINNLI